MAKQRFGINDGYRGTVGTVIGYQWRGKWCLRARPRFVRNPRTERQQRNRDLFKASVQLAGSMKEALRFLRGFHPAAHPAGLAPRAWTRASASASHAMARPSRRASRW